MRLVGFLAAGQRVYINPESVHMIEEYGHNTGRTFILYGPNQSVIVEGDLTAVHEKLTGER